MFGHLSGDKVLIKMMELCKGRVRGVDSLYRIGGEEFAILAVGIDPDGAVFLAEDIRKIVESADFIEDKTITVSIGIAECLSHDGIESLMGRADAALYRAKRKGRNRVCVDQTVENPNTLSEQGLAADPVRP